MLQIPVLRFHPKFLMWMLCGYCVDTVWILCGYCTAPLFLRPTLVGARATHITQHPLSGTVDGKNFAPLGGDRPRSMFRTSSLATKIVVRQAPFLIPRINVGARGTARTPTKILLLGLVVAGPQSVGGGGRPNVKSLGGQWRLVKQRQLKFVDWTWVVSRWCKVSSINR